MKATRIREVQMVRRIRDRNSRILAGKTTSEIIAFYRAAGEAAMEDARRGRNPVGERPANPALQAPGQRRPRLSAEVVRRRSPTGRAPGR